MTIQTIGQFLQKKGWRVEVAGTEDFNAACNAIFTACQKRLGLIVSGHYGCGKTLLAKAFCAGLSGPWFNVSLCVADELEKLTPSWQEYWACRPFARNVFLDDLGAENDVNEYGVRSERVAEFITKWHARAEPNLRLVITTNFNEGELDARYGGRVLSRLKDLCVPLHLTGGDKRKWNLPAGSTERRAE